MISHSYHEMQFNVTYHTEQLVSFSSSSHVTSRSGKYLDLEKDCFAHFKRLGLRPFVESISRSYTPMKPVSGQRVVTPCIGEVNTSVQETYIAW